VIGKYTREALGLVISEVTEGVRRARHPAAMPQMNPTLIGYRFLAAVVSHARLCLWGRTAAYKKSSTHVYAPCVGKGNDAFSLFVY
jgi:hypothetical protein